MDFVNWKLLKHPLNWFIVWMVLLLASAAYTFIHDGVTDDNN